MIENLWLWDYISCYQEVFCWFVFCLFVFFFLFLLFLWQNIFGFSICFVSALHLWIYSFSKFPFSLDFLHKELMNEWDIHSCILAACIQALWLFTSFGRRDSFSAIVKTELILRFFLKHLLFECLNTQWLLCKLSTSGWIFFFSLPWRGFLVDKAHPVLFRDITKNWAGFNFLATETVVISISYILILRLNG